MSYFKMFRKTAPTVALGSAHASKIAANAYEHVQKKILKIGAYGTVGAATGAGIGSLTSNDRPMEKKRDLKKSIIAGATAGALITGALIARRPIGTFFKAAGAGASEGSKVFFRRIRGRIVPIKVK